MSFNTASNNETETKKSIRIIFVQNHIQNGNDFSLSCFSLTKVSQLKQMIRKKTGIGLSEMKLLFKYVELAWNHLDIEDYGIKQNSTIKLLSATNTPKYMLSASVGIDDEVANAKFNTLKWKVEGALNSGIIPKLTDFGTQGTYILENTERSSVAIFKPYDEEAFAPNNPRGYIGNFKSVGLRPGVLSGEGAYREVASYLIDYWYGGYHNVPFTTYVVFCHPSFKAKETVRYQAIDDSTDQQEQIVGQTPIKRGSFQEYVKHDDSAGNYGSSLFSVEQVHKIAILDIRILNGDRNEENILVRKKYRKFFLYFVYQRKVGTQTNKNVKASYDFYLIPIDHGYSFPDQFKICQDEVVWFHWDQVKKGLSAQEKLFISRIDPKKDCELLRSKLDFREVCLRNFRVAEMFLKESSQINLTLFQMAQLLFREDADIPSQFEKALQTAEQNYSLNIKIPGKINGKQNGNGVHKYPSEKKNCSESKQKVDSTKQDMDKLNLFAIKEEIEPKLLFQVEESKDQLNSPRKISINRSISQPNMIKFHSSSISPLPKKVVQDKEYGEEFYNLVQFYIEILITQKLKEDSVPKQRTFRDRYRSEDLQ